MKDRSKKALTKRAKRGFRGYPVATVACYGPTDKLATMLVVGIVSRADTEPDSMRKWFSAGDVRKDSAVLDEVLDFVRDSEAKSVVMLDRVIGCPHEEGIDYPNGEVCPQCPFWEGRDRWSGEFEH
jgi:hypothetical protein